MSKVYLRHSYNRYLVSIQIIKIKGENNILGEKIGSISGTVSNNVLSAEGSLPKFSTSTEGAGTLAGAEVQIMATYSSTMRADGTLYGECPNQKG